MKDKYIKPVSESLEIEATLFAASFESNEESEDDVVAGARKRDPHQWGNLWCKE